ncbi:MAG: SLC13 family permease [bacterium]
MSNRTKIFISLIIPLIILLLPRQWLPINNLSVVEHRMICIFILAVLLWILEPIPVYSTSVIIIVAELVMISNQGFILFRTNALQANFGDLINYKEILGCFASPIIMLFLGGFFLAMAASKYQLDVNLARVMLRPFGTRTAVVLLGLMIITAVFSMFMSNTATTAMMLAILTPILKYFDDNDKGKIALILGIPFAANIGGIGTPIGTPPNAIALKYLSGDYSIGFGKWMSFALPYVIIMLLFVWILLLYFYSPSKKRVKINIKGHFSKGWKALTVYITFILTILLWLLDFLHGMNSYIVAMIPVAVFTCTTIISKKDLKRINWDVLWLMAGGIALGLGVERTGLAQHLIEALPFNTFSPYFVVIFISVLTILISNFMSNTATANLFLPLMAALGTSISGLAPLGGSILLILTVAFAASLAMAMPISTPPNAMAYGTGLIKTKEMIKTGIIIGAVGLLGLYLLMFLLNKINYIL